MCNTDEINNILKTFQFLFSIITMISCSVIILIYLKLKDNQDLSYRILFYMAITDTIRVIPFFFPDSFNSDKYSCLIFAIIINGSLLVNAIWSFYIIFILYRIFLNFPRKPEPYIKTWTFIGFVAAPITQLLPIITGSYGYNEGGCTYKSDISGIIWRSIQEISIFLGLCFSIILYFRLFYKIRKVYRISLKEIIFEKGMIYSLIFFFIMTVVLMFRFAEILFSFCDIYVLCIAAYSLVILHGFLNFLALILNKNFREYIGKVLCKERHRSESVIILLE